MSRHYRGGQMNPASPGRATGAAATATQVLAKSDRYSSGNKSSMLFLKDVCQHIPDMKAMPLPPNVIAEFTDNLVATAKIVATGQMKLEGYLKAMEKIKDSVRDDTPDAQSQVVDGMYKMRSLADNTKTLNDLVTKPFPNDCRALQQHKQLSDIEKLLGVDKSKGKKKGKKRKGDPDSDESDIEMLETEANQKASFTCPITRGQFVDPWKNKTCGHTISKAAYDQITDMKNFFCPIAGCSNSQQKNLRTDQAMWKKQWEADEDMVYQMEAHEKKKARAELRKKAKAEEESESDDDEEDEEDVEVL